MVMQDMKLETLDTSEIGMGLLGGSSPTRNGLEAAKEARLLMIEQRILRIEDALTLAGIFLPEPPQ